MIPSIKSLLTRSSLTDLLKQLIKFTFQLLILLLPTQLALHFWPNWAYVYGFRIDYFSPTLYLTDILMVLLFVFWAIQPPFVRAGNIKRTRNKRVYFLIATLFAVFIGINIYFAKSSWVAIYRWTKVVEFLLIGIFVARAKDFNFSNWIAKPLSFSLIAVCIIAFVQFNLQRTTGALFLLGERSFTATTPGIATFTLFGRELLRPYSIFPHPNVMAGFLGVGLFLLLIGLNKKQKTPTYYKLSLVIVLATLILSVSHGAWIALALVCSVFILAKFNANIFKRTYLLIVVSIIAGSLLLPTASDKLMSSYDYAEEVSHRMRLSKASGELIAENPMIGIGEGNYILGLIESADFPKTSWWLQPVHNIYLLVFSETGFVGFGIFVSLILFTANKAIIRKENKLLAAFLFVILTGFLDHYWITLQQTQILFAILVGLLLRKKG